MSKETVSKECKKCGKDLASFDESGGKKPCPNCGSKKRIKYAKAVSVAQATTSVNVKIFSPLSQHLRQLIEFHSEPMDDLEGRENSLGVILFAHIYLDTHLYESLVGSNIFTDQEYQDECDYIWDKRDNLRNKIRNILKEDPKFNNLDKKNIPSIEVKYFYLLREHLSVDFYDSFADNLKDFRRLVNLRKEITHFKKYEVTDIDSDDRLKEKI